MSPVEFRKTLCRPVDFKGQGTLFAADGIPVNFRILPSSPKFSSELNITTPTDFLGSEPNFSSLTYCRLNHHLPHDRKRQENPFVQYT